MPKLAHTPSRSSTGSAPIEPQQCVQLGPVGGQQDRGGGQQARQGGELGDCLGLVTHHQSGGEAQAGITGNLNVRLLEPKPV